MLGTSPIACTGTGLSQPASVTLANVQVLEEPGRHFTALEGGVVSNKRRLGSLCTHGSAQLWTIKTPGEDTAESGVAAVQAEVTEASPPAPDNKTPGCDFNIKQAQSKTVTTSVWLFIPTEIMHSPITRVVHRKDGKQVPQKTASPG